jgi:hypothetical protein
MDREMYEEIMADAQDGYDSGTVSREDLEAQKVAAEEGSLRIGGSSLPSVPQVRIPTVKPPGGGRQARRQAEAELARQWRMVQTTQRSIIAVNSIIAVAAHGQRQLDIAQEVMSDRFYGVKRRPAMNQFMANVTSRCLQMAEAGVMAILESHPRRVAEDL